ncbi:MAG: glycosyltransferase family 39 protein [Planctomycetota bacterium]
MTATNRAILGMLILGIVARFACLSNHSFWHDEGSTLYLATAPDPIEALRGSRHPPIAIFAFRYWIAMFGESDAAARSLSALVSCGSLVMFILLSKIWLGRFSAEAWAAAVLLYAIAPFQLHYASEVTPYAFFEFGSLLALLSLALAIAKQNVTIFHYLGVFCGVAMAFGSQYMGWLAGFCVAAISAAACGCRELSFKKFVLFTTSAILAGVAWMPWLLTIFQDQKNTIWGNEAKISLFDFAQLPARLLLFDVSVLNSYARVVSYILGASIWLGLAGFVICTIYKKCSEYIYILAAMTAPFAGAVALLFLMPPNFLPRYLTPAAPMVACASVAGICCIPWTLARRTLLILLIAGCGAMSFMQKITNRREDYRTVCAEVASAWKPGDRILVISGTPDPFAESTVRHYLRFRPEIAASIEHASVIIPKLHLSYQLGTRIHVVHREKGYSHDSYKAFFTIGKAIEETELRFGVRRALFEVTRKF